MGKHSFSSLNYLVEYTIRISVLLICVPIFGFYGIVISYLASNIVCNITRMIMIIKITGIKFSFSDNLIIPIISAVLSMQIVAVTDRLIHLDNLNYICLPYTCSLHSYTKAYLPTYGRSFGIGIKIN